MEKNKSVYEYIWKKVFPHEKEINYDDFYDWCAENANEALRLSFEYYELNKSN